MPNIAASSATSCPSLRASTTTLARLRSVCGMRVRELWDEAIPMRGTPAETYVRSRSLFGTAATLRYHPRTPLGASDRVRFRPALLAAIRSGDRIIALERLFLDPATSLAAADLDPAKRMLGRPHDGAVRFGVPDDTLGLAEGWVTAWSAHLLFGIPVWAVLGNERFPHVAIPECVKRLILLPDNDDAGHYGTQRAHEADARPGRTIDVWLPEDGLNDWNDQLQEAA
ncbi:MAG: toprim domain-containing protein [Sphingobium sp.]